MDRHADTASVSRETFRYSASLEGGEKEPFQVSQVENHSVHGNNGIPSESVLCGGPNVLRVPDAGNSVNTQHLGEERA